MVINFRTCGISRSTRKLTRIPMLNKKKKKDELIPPPLITSWLCFGKKRKHMHVLIRHICLCFCHLIRHLQG